MIVCNGRNLTAPLTGVQRYTSEILSRLPYLKTTQPAYPMHGITGHAWEQTVLPFRVGSNLLWSPSNTGPLAIRRQIVTVHDLATFDCPEGFSKSFSAYYHWLLPKLLPRVKAILTVSEFTRQRILEHFNLSADRVHVIPLGVNHERFYPRSASEKSLLHEKLSLPAHYILFLGALSRRKNIARLLEAWRMAQQQISEDIELVIAGSPGATRIFNGTILPTLPPRTRLLGFVEDNDLPILLSGATLFVFPSLYEGFGLPPLEAMACGTPCLVSNSTSLPEVTADAAYPVSPTNVENIAAALLQLVNSSDLLQNLSAAGLVRAQHFQWATTASATESVLRAY